MFIIERIEHKKLLSVPSGRSLRFLIEIGQPHIQELIHYNLVAQGGN